MPELRKDPIIGRWVIISVERAKRPNDFKVSHPEEKEGLCPFCEGHEKDTIPEVYAVRKRGTEKDGPGWNIRVVPSISERLDVNDELDRRGVGMYDVMNPLGAHEVIVESPKHFTDIHELPARQIENVIKTFKGIDRPADRDGSYQEIDKNRKEKRGLFKGPSGFAMEL